jgi:hypothetical protein
MRSLITLSFCLRARHIRDKKKKEDRQPDDTTWENEGAPKTEMVLREKKEVSLVGHAHKQTSKLEQSNSVFKGTSTIGCVYYLSKKGLNWGCMHSCLAPMI